MFYRVLLIPPEEKLVCEHKTEGLVCLEPAKFIFQTDFIIKNLCQFHLNQFRKQFDDSGTSFSDESFLSTKEKEDRNL